MPTIGRKYLIFMVSGPAVIHRLIEVILLKFLVANSSLSVIFALSRWGGSC
jgi:hypothetical protein